MSKIYLATSGTGKTYFCQHNLGWIDLDGWLFWNKLSDKMNEDLFIKMISFYQYSGYNILISSVQTAQYLVKNNIQIDGYIIPANETKNEIFNRLINRDPHNHWSYVYMTLLDKDIAQLIQLPGPKFYLKSGQYVSDIIDGDGNIKIKEANN